MGLFSKKQSTPICAQCDGAGRIQTGKNKWTGATFSTCPSCGGTGTR